MTRFVLLPALAGSLMATLATGLPAQQTPAPAARPPAPQTYEEFVTAVWSSVHDKILVMAKDLPEDKLSWRPHPDSRTMLDEFRHVTIGLEMSTAQLRGETFDYMARLKADETKPKTRESIVKEMDGAIATSYAQVKSKPAPRLVWWIDHQGEHYGKLVSNYRSIGLVPPVSRPRS